MALVAVAFSLSPVAADPLPVVAKKQKAPAATPQPVVIELVIKSKFAGKQHVVIVAPPDYETSTTRYPAVMAFAGLGETVRGNKAGAWGWVEKYGVIPAMSALHRQVLTKEDFQGLATPDEVEAYNAVLKTQPYQGVILVCPFPPRISRGASPNRPKFEQYLLEELMPHVEANYRVTGKWGIDGISLGGLISTYWGFKYPSKFDAIGSQQAAVSSRPVHLKKLMKTHADELRKTKLNVATSGKDPFRKSITKFHGWLKKEGIDSRFTVLPGRHDKRFVKGPGSLELLLFHDRALRGDGPMPPTRNPK